MKYMEHAEALEAGESFSVEAPLAPESCSNPVDSEPSLSIAHQLLNDGSQMVDEPAGRSWQESMERPEPQRGASKESTLRFYEIEKEGGVDGDANGNDDDARNNDDAVAARIAKEKW